MKKENLAHAIGQIDDDLIERAESRTAAGAHGKVIHYRSLSRRLAACAACLVLTVTVCATAYATGFVDNLLAYFGGNAGSQVEQIASVKAAVSNGDIELRVDGAIADEHACQMLVSFVGLTDKGTKLLQGQNLEVRDDMKLSAKLHNGDIYPITTYETATYVEGNKPIRKAQSLLADAEMTYLVSYLLEDNVRMRDIASLQLDYAGLVLDVEMTSSIVPEKKLSTKTGTAVMKDFYVSEIGFYFTAPIGEDFDSRFDIKLMKLDGTYQEFSGSTPGYHLGLGYEDGDDYARVSGRWTDSSPVSVSVMNLDDYLGVQVDGVDYVFDDAAS